jgi:tetratricopeptide (TPR) repeat protein
MGVFARASFAALLVILTARPLSARQDLPPALVEQFSKGVNALKAGDLDTAETWLRAVLAGGGNRALVHHNLGIVLEQRGRHDAALVEFRAASRLDPSFGPSRLLAGSSLLALGRPREAVVELQRAVKLLPKEVAAHRQLAEACEAAGDVPCLARALKTAADLSPDDPESLYRLGKAYLRLSQWSYERIQRIAPASPRLSEALGREMIEQGRLDDALYAYRQAAERGPTLAGLHLAMARIHLDQGHLDEALAEIDKELAIAPESAAALQVKAAIVAARTGRK